MKKMLWLLILLLCLTLPALAEEAITVEGIEDGVTVMDEGFLHLDFSGMEEGKLYRGTLSFTNANGVAREEYCAFSTPEEAYLSVGMAGAPGEYGPFTLTLTCEGETVGQWTFMGQVPEGEILVDSRWSSWNDDYQPSMSYAAAIPGDGQATCANTAAIQLKGPLDGSVMLGQPGYSLDVEWKMQQPGRYLLYLVDAQDGSIVWEDLYEAQDSEWIGYRIHPELTGGKMYQFVAVYGQEVAYTNFFVMDESAWNGVNPWDAVASAPDLLLPDSVLASAAAYEQPTITTGNPLRDTWKPVGNVVDWTGAEGGTQSLFETVVVGDPEYDTMTTPNIRILSPAYRSAIVGQAGAQMHPTWTMQEAGTYYYGLVDPKEGRLLYNETFESQGDETVSMTLPPLQLNHWQLYQFVVVHNNEMAYTNFVVLDANAWDGTNPWLTEGVDPNSLAEGVEPIINHGVKVPEGVTIIGNSAVQDAVQVGWQPEGTLMRVTGLEDFMMERYRPYGPMMGVEESSRAYSMEDGTIFYINMPSRETDQLVRPHAVSILSGSVSQPEATTDGLQRAAGEHINLLMDLSLSLAQQQETTVLPLHIPLMAQLLEAKSINTWKLYSDAALMDAAVADGWQLVFFGMTAADGSLYNGQVYLFAQKYIPYAIEGSEDQGLAPYRIVIADQAQVEEALEYCLFNLASTSQEQMDALTALYDGMQ